MPNATTYVVLASLARFYLQSAVLGGPSQRRPIWSALLTLAGVSDGTVSALRCMASMGQVMMLYSVSVFVSSAVLGALYPQEGREEVLEKPMPPTPVDDELAYNF